MCLYVQEPIKIAKKDIVCYKILFYNYNRLFSPYYDQTWELDREYTLYPDECDYADNSEIGYGFFHSFCRKEEALEEIYSTPLKNLSGKLLVFEAIIPKGSVYFIGRGRHATMNYASNKLKITEKIL